MKKVIYGFLLIFVMFSFQSCLHDEKNLFSDSASERIDKAVTVDQQMLESSTNGWVLNYYPGKSYSDGGYVYLAKFKNGKVTMASEFSGSDSTFTSDYAMVKDQGPVLTFDTYNPIMHWLSEASEYNVDTYQGDYEFVVSKATSDSIVMTGKKWGNKMVMTRIPEKTKWSVYLDSINTMVNSMGIGTFKYMVGNDSVANISINIDTHIAKVTTSEGSSSISFTPTTNGLSLCTPINVNNTSIDNLIWDGTSKYSSKSASNVSIVFCPPAGYHKIADIAGTYNLYVNNNTEYYTFTLTPNAKNTALITHEDGFPFDLTFAYSRGTGSISLTTQDLGTYTDSGETYDIMLLPADLNSGYYYGLPGLGMNLVPVAGKDYCYKFVDNGMGGTSFATDSFVFESYLNGSDAGYILEWSNVTYMNKVTN